MQIAKLDLPGIKKVASGKVREIFDLGDRLLIVSTDRISAFDCILPTPIPGKGEVLNQLSAYWFERLDFVPNHLLHYRFEEFPPSLKPFRAQLSCRSMIVKKCSPLPVECIVRGYLAGSALKEYKTQGTAAGVKLPPGLQPAEKFPSPIFTPARKATSGHDENITWQQFRAILGDDLAWQLREWSLELYSHARARAEKRGIIIADTKFEFGLFDGQAVLIDECITPDSSRFWPAQLWRPGLIPPSYDKQYVRDYLESINWNKIPPAPPLPQEVVDKTAEIYREALDRLVAN